MQVEVHDSDILAHARSVLNACRSPQEIQEAILSAVARNEEWRGRQCINLLAPEAPTSPTVRMLLSSDNESGSSVPTDAGWSCPFTAVPCERLTTASFSREKLSSAIMHQRCARCRDCRGVVT